MLTKVFEMSPQVVGRPHATRFSKRESCAGRTSSARWWGADKGPFYGEKLNVTSTRSCRVCIAPPPS